MSEEQQEYRPQIRSLMIWPTDVLEKPCAEVTEFDDNLERLVNDMFATMVANQGVGLAANQIGVSDRVITIRIDPNDPFYLINPEIIVASEDMFTWEEGCLSVPGYFEDRERPKTITVRYNTLDGSIEERILSELAAFAVQHEMDHLDGKTFVDDVSFFKKGRVKKKIKKALPDQVATAEYARIHLDEWWDNMIGGATEDNYEEQLTGQKKDTLLKEKQND